MKPGQNIKYTYKHWLNSRSHTIITKKGTIEKIVGNVAHVKLEGNSTISKIPIHKLDTQIQLEL